ADPLVLIDGVEQSLSTVEPSAIESISVLKDAASASIYGSRAANGVILIETKRGQSSGMSVTYNT
ncbi:MAG: TonB-dependent receptor plug domain-containing protein, partial [Aliifodinibius sp.]|nr:TonB-dependent receptor plug domain-containing protein [Fodinibius sp.]NIX00612.1 TonB-dependent receptor plug domain-containing protein [Phycisphaerae bacterium]NIY23550.1 TonB-dependent receptor plug domain-containing protein [Fodinibius sp.]